MTAQFDYYSILGIDRRATRDDVKEAFDALCLNFPKNQQNPDTNPNFQRILTAYEVLVDDARRKTYDSLLVETSPLSLKIEVIASREQINQSDTQQLLYLLVEASPPQYITEKQQPLNLCLVIDRSTSMQGERLRSVKAAVNLIVEKLSSEDYISIISFSDRADVVVPGGPVTNRKIINGRVRNISASGGTEIYQGLKAGFQQLQQVNLEDYTNHLILLTDGHTYGDAAECLDLANRASLTGVGFSAFGIGTEWNDQFLDQLVVPSGGQSGYIESPKMVIDFLRDRIKGLGQIYAQNMRLKNEFPRSISINKGFKLVPFAQPLSFDDPEIRLGDIEGRYPISFLLEIAVDPQPIETRINIPILLTADIPGQRTQERTFKHTQEIFVLNKPLQTPPPEKIVEAVRVLNMYEMNEKVLEEIDAGRLDVATRRMKHLTTRLLQAGQTQLAHQAHSEAQRLENMGTMSMEGRKKLKYGTRALMNQTINLNTND